MPEVAVNVIPINAVVMRADDEIAIAVLANRRDIRIELNRNDTGAGTEVSEDRVELPRTGPAVLFGLSPRVFLTRPFCRSQETELAAETRRRKAR